MTTPVNDPLIALQREIQLKKEAVEALHHTTQLIHELNQKLSLLSPLPSPHTLSLPPPEQLKSYIQLAYRIQSEEITEAQEQEITGLYEEIGKMKAEIGALQERVIALKTLIIKFEHLIEAKKASKDASQKLSYEIKK
ncbi:MAG: hypothetical protein QRY71_05865 [Candidatus Rhabdochlamydia sp.]